MTSSETSTPGKIIAASTSRIRSIQYLFQMPRDTGHDAQGSLCLSAPSVFCRWPSLSPPTPRLASPRLAARRQYADRAAVSCSCCQLQSAAVCSADRGVAYGDQTSCLASRFPPRAMAAHIVRLCVRLFQSALSFPRYSCN